MSGGDACDNCLGRVPFGSLFALVLTWLGVGLFCVMMYQAVNASLRQAQEVFGIQLPWLDKVQLSFIIVATVMAFVALVLLVLGALATGETRKSIYQGWRARLGGRVSCAIFMVLTYVLNICWLAIFTFSVVLAFVYMVFEKLCPKNFSGSSNYELDLSVFAALLNGTSVQPRTVVLTGQNLRQFCGLTDDANDWYFVAYFACALVILGLIQFMVCMAANYAHIKDEIKYMELEGIRMEEMNGMDPRF